MSKKILAKGNYRVDNTSVNFYLVILHFVDESKILFYYSPHLDLSGYGESEDKAKESFQIAIDDFIDYTFKKKTIKKVLTELGWTIKKSVKQKPKAPIFSELLRTRPYMSEILDNYNVNTFRENIKLPAFA